MKLNRCYFLKDRADLSFVKKITNSISNRKIRYIITSHFYDYVIYTLN